MLGLFSLSYILSYFLLRYTIDCRLAAIFDAAWSIEGNL